MIYSRANIKLVALKGIWKTFLTGKNSACCVHAQQHYNLYTERCAGKGIPEHPHAVPLRITKACEEEAKKAGKSLSASKLEGHGFEGIQATGGPKEFSKDNALEHMVKYIICTDQVSKR